MSPEPADASRHDLSAVVTRLREAGCVFSEDEATLLVSAATTTAELSALVEQRVSGIPLEHLLGWAEFSGLRVRVDTGVFVPRRRTELLVREAVSLARRGDVVVDVCCGSGAVGLAVATAVRGVELHAVDIDHAAVRCARRNLAAVGGEVYDGDLYEPLPARLLGCVDLILANAPYVPSDAIGLMPPEARLHEPRVALDGGPDGLDVQRRVIAAARTWLAPGGHVVVETSERQAALTVDAYRCAGLLPRVVTSDELGGTVVLGDQVPI